MAIVEATQLPSPHSQATIRISRTASSFSLISSSSFTVITLTDKETTETSWYISSRNIDAAACAKSIRSHWQVENPLHWRLDVVFNDDKYNLYSANGAKNMAIIKRFCMNLLDQTQLNIRRKCGLKSKIMAAAIDDNFRELALFG
jgi:predicted transposase YbfD/YdcC